MTTGQISAEPRYLGEILGERWVMPFGTGAIRDGAIEYRALVFGENQCRRRVWRGPVDHRHPENPPAQQTEDCNQVDQALRSTQLGLFGTTS